MSTAGGQAETQRVCTPGQRKPNSERTSTHEFRVIDIRSATIVSGQSALRTEEVPLGNDGDGDGPTGERGSGAFDELFRYWRDAGDIGAGRARNAVAHDERLQVLGEYRLRYSVRLWTITCTRWEECNAQGTGFVARRRLMMSESGTAEGETPPATANVPHADRNTVTREVMRVVQALVRDLQAANRAAEQDARRFCDSCR